MSSTAEISSDPNTGTAKRNIDRDVFVHINNDMESLRTSNSEIHKIMDIGPGSDVPASEQILTHSAFANKDVRSIDCHLL